MSGLRRHQGGAELPPSALVRLLWALPPARADALNPSLIFIIILITSPSSHCFSLGPSPVCRLPLGRALVGGLCLHPCPPPSPPD